MITQTGSESGGRTTAAAHAEGHSHRAGSHERARDDLRRLPAPLPSRRVVVISPSFFGYEKDIVEAFRRDLNEVMFVDERPSNSSIVRAALRLGLAVARPSIDRHFQRSYGAIGQEPVDLVLVIKGESTPPWFLERLRRDHPGIRIIYYSFDRIRDGENGLRLIPLCDEAYSFDPVDVVERNLTYKPLFFGPLFERGRPLALREFDVSFVGTAHSDRWTYVNSVTSGFARRFLFFYSPARWFFAAKKYLGRELRQVPWSAVDFEKKSKAQVANVFARSRAVVDLQRSGQSGLTMRTFEVLASGARLITSNESVRDLDVYTPESVLVVPPERALEMAAEIKEFVDRPRQDDEGVDMSAYSLEAWVREFLPVAASR